MVKKSAILLLVLTLTGCQSTQPVVVTQEVLVPVYKHIDVPERALPHLPVQDLSIDSSDRDTVIAYDKSINLLMQEIVWYRGILEEIKNDTKSSGDQVTQKKP